MVAWFSHASGIIIMIDVRDGPAGQPEQLGDLVEGRRVARRPGCRSGTAPRGCRPAAGCASCDWRARIQLRLPLTVLISPLCAMVRNGWASGQDGKVLVEKRECTMRQLGLEALVREVRVERLQLGGGQHALVDDGPGGQRREVDAELVLGALAQPEGLRESEFVARPRSCRRRLASEARKSWTKCGMQARAMAPDQVRDHRAPRASPGRQALVRRPGPRTPALAASASLVLGGQERGADGVLAGGGQLEIGDGTEEFVRDLREQAGAVAGAFVGADGAAVFEVAQRGQRGVDDVVPGFAAQRGDDGQAAGVLLVLRAVEPGGVRHAPRNA